MPLSRARLASSVVIAAAFAFVQASRPARADEPSKQACVAANESAQDLEGTGKLLDARAQLRTCTAKACPRAVRQDCSDRLAELESKLPTVVITPRDASGENDVGGAALSIDGALQPNALDGTPIPVDPGPHVFTVSLPGRAPVALRFAVNAGERATRDAVFRAVHPATKVGSTEDARDGGDAVVAQPEAPSSPAETTDESDVRAKTLHRVGWAAVGVGAAGVALGSIFGVLAFGRRSSLTSACSNYSCPGSSQHDIDALGFDAVTSTVSFVVGVLGLGAGGALVLLVPDHKAIRASTSAVRATPWIGPGNAGISGTFQ